MFKIICSELTGETCDFVVEDETKEEVKANYYYKHGAESPIHREMYNTVTDEQKAVFGKKVDEYLSR